MVMSTDVLRRYIAPILQSRELPHLDTVRIGTKSLAYWPYRYLTDPDAKALLGFFAEIVASGKHLAFQAHFSNPRELETPMVQEAIRMIRMTGAQIRTQSPLIRNVNDNTETWAKMWRIQTRLGAVPYYMLVQGLRDRLSERANQYIVGLLNGTPGRDIISLFRC
jgi:L-lysine 2,3-aminomutase